MCHWHELVLVAGLGPLRGHRPRRARLPGPVRHGPVMKCVRWRRWKSQSPGRLFGDASQDNVGGEAFPPATPGCLELGWCEFEIQGTSLYISATTDAYPASKGATESGYFLLLHFSQLVSQTECSSFVAYQLGSMWVCLLHSTTRRSRSEYCESGVR